MTGGPPVIEPLVDSHCHLGFDRFEADLEDVLSRAQSAGVTRMIDIGCARSTEAVAHTTALARAHPGRVFPTIGVHPHDAAAGDDALLDAVARHAAEPMVVAVGETGLDHHYDHAPRPQQALVFRRQIAIARAVRKPLVVHTRAAPEETLRILVEERAADVGGVIHCFSEDAAFARAALDLGFALSFSGLVTFPRGTEGIREAARLAPADAILVETDAPYLAPVPHRGKRNEPAFVAHTAAALAALRGEEIADLRRRTTENAVRVFRLDA